MFVFRNNTIERFFPMSYHFSGYGDISYIPDDDEGYVWFYQEPFGYDSHLISQEIDNSIQKLRLVIDKIKESKTIVALTMERLYSVPFTNSDLSVRVSMDRYNTNLITLAEKRKNLKVIDFCEFCQQYTKAELIDWKFYFISQMGLNPRLSKPFQAWFNHKIEQIALKRKKCIVLDVDNTLWGGVVGEDGVNGIQIGGDYPGKAFLYFQKALLELYKNGVILTICSKNNEQDVLEVWDKNPYILLKKEHFAAWRINWQDKVSNIEELAKELNIGLDSMVFIDDNPTERQLVEQMLPMVSVADFPTHPYDLPLFVERLVEDYFKIYTTTEEDRGKTEQYKANSSRLQEQKRYADFGDFLKSLGMVLTIEKGNEFNIPRIAQMTQKTNQFNLTTHRYTDADIHTMINNGCQVYCLSVADKFGDSGITGCIIINNNEIDTLLLSCRILGKGIETAFVKTILKRLIDEGKKDIKARYIPTTKNMQVADFYEKNGFDCIAKDDIGGKEYIANLEKIDLNIDNYYSITLR